MNLASNGNVELMLPSPRWPDSVDMKGKADFVGDTLLFKADTPGSALPDGRCALYGESRPRTSCTSPASGWIPAAGGGRRSWGPGRSPESGGPLLGDAVERAEAPDQIGAVDADDLAGRGRPPAAWPEPPRRAAGRRSGSEHEAVGDVEVGVARRQALALVIQGARHRQRDDPQRPTVLVASSPRSRSRFCWSGS